MKKSVRKSLFIIIVFSFLFMLFAGCSTSSGGGTPSGSTGTEGNGTATQSGSNQTPDGSDDTDDDEGETGDDDVSDDEDGDNDDWDLGDDEYDDYQNDNFPKEVKFGSWPQSIKAEYVTIDHSYTITVGAFNCYRGNDGALYVKKTEYNHYSSGENTLYYSDGSKVGQSGEEKYFKIEPIKWEVVTDNYNGTGKKLLVCNMILMIKPFYQYNDQNYLYVLERTIDGKTVYPNNYKHSEIRAFLNGLSFTKRQATWDQETETEYLDKGFLQTAFTMHERAVIKETNVDNSAESTTDETGTIKKSTDYICEATLDKIFLLSEKEVTNSEYGFSAYDEYGEDNTRCRKLSDFAKAFSSIVTNEAEFHGANWWLRSPYPDTVTQAGSTGVSTVGSAGEINVNSWGAPEDAYGIVPALCVDELPEVHSVNVCKAGDIVFKDGTAIAYKDGLTLSDEQKANVMAYIYYEGGDETLGDRKLGFGFIGPETGAWAYQNSGNSADNAIGFDSKLLTSDNYGKENLALIKKLEDYSYNYDENKYPAFRIVVGYNNWYALGYYFNDWYIPSKAEIDKIGSQKDEIFSRLEKLGLQNPFTSGNSGQFWSSSQCKLSSEEASLLNIDNPDQYAYAYDFGTGKGQYQLKSWGLYVCVIREF